jgi:hypothetical protein
MDEWWNLFDNVLNSVAPLACVGTGGIARLWDTESHQPLLLRLSHEGGQSLHSREMGDIWDVVESIRKSLFGWRKTSLLSLQYVIQLPYVSR